jgi:hypothetical protein
MGIKCSQRGNKMFPTWEQKETSPKELSLGNPKKNKLFFGISLA